MHAVKCGALKFKLNSSSQVTSFFDVFIDIVGPVHSVQSPMSTNSSRRNEQVYSVEKCNGTHFKISTALSHKRAFIIAYEY